MDLVTAAASAHARAHARADARRRPDPHVVVGAAHPQHARPRHRAAARSARRAAPRDRHRPRGALPDLRARPGCARRRRDLRCPLARAFNTFYAEAFRDHPRDAHAGRDHPDAHARGGDRRARPRDRRARVSRRSCSAVRSAGRHRASTRRRARRAGSTRSASTRSTTTTRCGSAASSSACRRRSTPRRWAGPSARRSTNYVFNHIGMFAIARRAALRSRCSWAACPQRFPTLRFAFLEGGVAWAAALYANLDRPLGEAQPRRGRALQPGAPRPRAGGAQLFEEYGSAALPRAARPARRRPAHAQPARRGPGDARRVRAVRDRERRRHPRRCSRRRSTSAARPTTR